jgi:DNA-binding XRE family transcriptional regulator
MLSGRRRGLLTGSGYVTGDLDFVGEVPRPGRGAARAPRDGRGAGAMDPKELIPSAGGAAGAAQGALRRRRPRSFEEWKALSSWGRLPAWEMPSAGYQLRRAREEAGLTQAELARRLGVSQQAVARAERWDSNPTFRLLESWSAAVGASLRLEIDLLER